MKARWHTNKLLKADVLWSELRWEIINKIWVIAFCSMLVFWRVLWGPICIQVKSHLEIMLAPDQHSCTLWWAKLIGSSSRALLAAIV